MKVADLTKNLHQEDKLPKDIMQMPVSGICYDSRKCGKNYVFFAIKGYKTDGHNYIKSALEKGALIVFADEENKERFSNEDFFSKIIFVENTRKALALCAKKYYKNPAKKLKVISVTGTNGKTSITYMIKAVLDSAGIKCGVLGTIAYILGDKKIKAPNTTPESIDIYRMMSEMVELGCEYCIMEVSSHALFLNRAHGIDFDVCIFTNLSEDHMDFHKDFDDYLNAKLILFEELKNSAKTHKLCVINMDSHVYGKVKNRVLKLGLNYLTTGIENNADYKVSSHTSSIDLNEFTVQSPKGKRNYYLHLLGNFNVLNALCVIAALDFFNIKDGYIKAGLESVSVPGRFQRIDSKKGFTVIIDYAHTNDALENVLSTIKGLKPNRIINVFGCGGDRDTVKRALMGQVSAHYADLTIITSDNPRSEEPEKIIEMIEQGVKKGHGEYIKITQREEAIKHSIEMAKPGDIILVAGKGHEDYQILGDTVIHFDDFEIAQKYVYKIYYNNK